MMLDAEALLGRERELAAVGRFLAALEEAPAALMLAGEPGIGKTVLFEHAVGEAREHGFRILAARPTAAEGALSFVGLTDLLSDAREVFAELPSPQRRALDVALLLAEETDAPTDPRAIGTGLLGVLRALASSCPVVVAVDDLQWLDAPSAAALAFALRRVREESIGLLAAVRKDSGSAGLELPESFRSDRAALGPLSVGAIHALLADRLQLSIPRTLLLRIYEACRGNPLFALEVGRALQEQGLPEPGRPFEIPADAETLFAARLEQLPQDTLAALAVAAVNAAPTRSLVGTADVLEPAVRGEIIQFEGERLRFTHPLLASAVYARLDPGARRALHRRIATQVTDREERARHLALGVDAPDAEIAAALDEAVGQAAGRGAPATAAELADLAVRLTPRDDRMRLRIRRRIAAQQHSLAGDVAYARELLEQLVEELPAGVERARALLQLAETRDDDVAAARSLCEEALAEAIPDDALLARAHRQLAAALQLSGNRAQALAEAREALAVAERTPDARLLASGLSYVAFFELWGGRVTPGLLERALQLEPQAGYLPLYERPSAIDGLRLMLLEDDLAGARARLSEAEQVARDHGDEDSHSSVLLHLAELECRSGRFDDAARHAGEGYALTDQLGREGDKGALLYVVALADALRGRAESARTAAERGLALAENAGSEIYAVHNLRVLGLLALSTGDWSTAAQFLAPLPARLVARGYGRSSILRILPDAIEALIAVGDLDAAARNVEQLDEIAGLGIAYAHARAARCRGLLAAARRDHAAALDAFSDALAAHERLPDPLERGRTLLALGSLERRAKQKRAAREALEAALEIFEQLGARLWAARARAELSLIGGRAPAKDALTPAERRVAELVAEGRTNREVAAALVVSEHTVESHLRRVYRKLGVRSRAELARRFAEPARAPVR
jgi:DNA-binding CsgD family transcriptional regulator